MVNAKLDSTGELWVYYGAAAGSTTDFTFDVTGYYVSGSGGYYYPIPSTRIFDTRSTGKLKANSPALVKASGLAGVPAFGAAGSPTGVVGNLTVTGPSAAGQMGVTNLTSAPTITTVSFPSGDARAGEACSLLWISGVWLGYVAPSGATTDATFDLAGFFSAASSY
jgi:hypothetical protein